MATALKHRKGTQAQHASFTGAEAEFTYDQTLKTARVHDGVTPGGFPVVTTGMLSGSRNRIINGDFRVSQYNGANAVTPTTTAYVIDRWLAGLSTASKLTFQQVTDAPTGFKYSLKVTVAAQYSPTPSDLFNIQQRIEGLNVIDFAFGTSGAIQATLSGYIKGSVPGQYGVALSNISAGGSPRTYTGTITVTSAWAPIIVTIPGDQAGTWLTDTSAGVGVIIDLGSGANYNAPATNTWQAGTYTRTAGCVTFVNQPAGSTLNITGVQLEAGSASSSFDRVDYGEMLRRCQRYFASFGGNAAWERMGALMCNTATLAYCSVSLPVDMRANPIVGYSSLSHFNIFSAGGNIVPTSIGMDSSSVRYPALSVGAASGLVAGYAGQLVAANTTAARLTFSSEL